MPIKTIRIDAADKQGKGSDDLVLVSSSTGAVNIEPDSQILAAAKKLAATANIPDASDIVDVMARQVIADALQKGLFPDIPNAADALLDLSLIHI